MLKKFRAARRAKKVQRLVAEFEWCMANLPYNHGRGARALNVRALRIREELETMDADVV